MAAATQRDLVTGAFGFTGMNLVVELLSRGHEVVATDVPAGLDGDRGRRIARGLGLDLEHPNLTLVPADFLEPGSLAALAEAEPTRVFHTASLYDYSAPLDKLMRINVDGTRNLLEALSGLELERFVHWSTCGVFGKPYTAADGAKVNVPFEETSSSPKNTPDDATEPEGTHLVNDYSVSKWHQEKMMWRAHRERGLPLTVVRPAPIYGPGSTYGHGGITLAIAQGWVPAIPEDAKNYVTTSVHVSDVAGFAAFIADRDDAIGEDYDIVDNSIVSYHEFLTYIALLCGRRMRTIPGLRLEQLRPAMVGAAKTWTWLHQTFGLPRVKVFEVQSATYISSSYWISNRKTLATGYEYRYLDVREGLKDTIAFMRHMGWLTDPRELLA